MEFLKTPHFDFLGKARMFVGLSLLLVVGGAAYVWQHGLQYGVEFSGGSQIIARFETRPELDKIRAAVDRIAPGAVIQTFDEPQTNQVLIRAAGEIQGELSEQADAVLAAVAQGYPGNRILESSTDIVGPVVGAELRRKAVLLTVVGLLFQLVYIAFRFQGAVWGTAAALAVFHDVTITLGLLTVFGYDVTLNVIAALLTLVGYSVNDTIVIFDRVRENLRQRRRDDFATVINDSINQTLSRTLITSGLTFLAVAALFFFGGEVLRGFAFTLLVGIIVGTYSSIYVAGVLVAWWRSRSRGALATPGARAAV